MKLEYYDLGKEDEDKETELSLFDKKNIKAHESSCCLVSKSLKNDNGNSSFDMSKIDTNEYLKLLSMNVSKIVLFLCLNFGTFFLIR